MFRSDRYYRFTKAMGYRRYCVFMRLPHRSGRQSWDFIGTVFQLKTSPDLWHAIYRAKMGVNAEAPTRQEAADILGDAYLRREKGRP